MEEKVTKIRVETHNLNLKVIKCLTLPLLSARGETLDFPEPSPFLLIILTTERQTPKAFPILWEESYKKKEVL